MPMIVDNPTTLKRLVLTRYYLGLADGHAKSGREVDVFVTVNQLHEAIETFLIAAAAHVNAAIGTREEFASYFDKIDQKISPMQLPFRSKIIRLNKARIMAKHDSIVPDRSELPGFLTTVREFLMEATNMVFSADFRAVSLIDALSEGPERSFLYEAQTAFERGDFAGTLIACRKAIYLRHEKSYDAKLFLEGQKNGFDAVFSRVPFYARNEEYLSKYVKEPADYIILDHSKIDSELVKDGLDSHQFWNIWRLTPRVYLAENDRWIVRHEPGKVEAPDVEENASYVLDSTVDHFIALERARARQRMVGPSRWAVTSGPSGTRLFVRASESSDVVDTVPPGVTLNADAATEGLDGEAMFWRVSSTYQGKWYTGYALEDELQFE